ncbi:TPA: hypothetical protein ACGW3G_000914 [Stenotrophomonas maltophilia]
MQIIHFTRSAHYTYAVAICPTRGPNWRTQKEARVIRFNTLGIADPLALTAVPRECQVQVLKRSSLQLGGHGLKEKLRQAVLNCAINCCNEQAVAQCLEDVRRGIAFPHTDRSKRYAILGERHVNG